jgi:purine-cytosine permease-like protein
MPHGFIAGFALVVISAVFHATCIVIIADWLSNRRENLELKFSLTRTSILLTSVFVLIVILHLTEIVFWAAAYQVSGLIDSFDDAFYFSLGSYTTIGSPGVQVPERWRTLGGMESIAGMLLGGLSTAFLFTIVRQCFDMGLRHRLGISTRGHTNEST